MPAQLAGGSARGNRRAARTTVRLLATQLRTAFLRVFADFPHLPVAVLTIALRALLLNRADCAARGVALADAAAAFGAAAAGLAFDSAARCELTMSPRVAAQGANLAAARLGVVAELARVRAR